MVQSEALAPRNWEFLTDTHARLTKFEEDGITQSVKRRYHGGGYGGAEFVNFSRGES